MPDILVQVSKNPDCLDVSAARVKKLVKAVCTRFTSDEARNTRYEISIAIVDDAQIRKLNRQFRNRNTVTDCLSFDLSDDKDRKSFELVVNAQKAVRQAGLRGHPAEAELALYITHALLHNLGFDDSAAAQARKMHEIEDQILQQLGYGSVYNRNADNSQTANTP